MSIADQIADFTAFAKRLVEERGDEGISLDTVIDQWQALNQQDVAAVREALESYDAGERGIPAKDAMQQLRARLSGKSEA